MEKIDIPVCLKVGQERWIRSLSEGTACFNRAGFFIEKAAQTGNNEQGDLYEGVFARLRQDNPLLLQTIERFKDDIELIYDGEYTILRRSSARNIPIFCMYGIRKDELNVVKESVYFDKISRQYKGKVHYDFPEKLYRGFLDFPEKTVTWNFLCSAGHLFDSIEAALRKNRYTYSKCVVKYDIDISKEFYIEPDAEGPYSELTHKRIDLAYQHEVRFFLPENPTSNKILVTYEPISLHSGGITPGECYAEMDVTLSKEE